MKERQTLERTINRPTAGFSLMELLVAMAVFMVIGGAAFNLVRRHVPLYNAQQSQAGLNMTMRNAATQIQIDAVNAGSGFYTGTNVPAWPVGITIVNNPASSSCFNSTTFTYGATCFDWLNIITTDSATAPGRPTGNTTGTTDVDTSTMSTLYLKPLTALTSTQLTAYANSFKNGDKILFINQDGSRMTSTQLTADGVVQGTTLVKLRITPTDSSGTSTADPMGLTNTAPTDLGSQFSKDNDYIVKLTRVAYCVDTSTASNPRLVRMNDTTSTTCSGTATNANYIADQIIGFKVGAYVKNSIANDDTIYNFDRGSSSYQWGAIRSIRVSLIGRTPVNATSSFRNSFDLGPYKVEAVSVVVNPRNLSMND